MDHFWGFRAFSKKQKLKRKFSDNLGQNCGLLHSLAQFTSTTSDTELDYYRQKINVDERVTKPVAKRHKTFRILGN